MNTLNDAITRVDEIILRLGNAQTIDEINAKISLDNDLKHLLMITDSTFKYKVKKLLAERYGTEIVNYLIPASKRGTKAAEKNPFSPLGKNLIDYLNGKKVLGDMNIVDSTKEAWDCETIKSVSNLIVDFYENAHSKANYLSTFRKILENIGVDAKDIMCSAHPEVTKIHNEKMADKQRELIEKGVDLPDEYKNVDELNARIDAFLTGGKKPNGQVAADLLVALSARPGESETLEIGQYGKIRGVLKKRGDDLEKEYNLITAVGIDRASAFLNKWRSLIQQERTDAMVDLKKFAAKIGVQRRHFRMIGAFLAAKEARKAGLVKNDAQERLLHLEALRHEPHKMAAQDHYLKINDSPIVSQSDTFEISKVSENEIIERLNKLHPGDRALVIGLIYRLSE